MKNQELACLIRGKEGWAFASKTLASLGEKSKNVPENTFALPLLMEHA